MKRIILYLILITALNQKVLGFTSQLKAKEFRKALANDIKELERKAREGGLELNFDDIKRRIDTSELTFIEILKGNASRVMEEYRNFYSLAFSINVMSIPFYIFFYHDFSALLSYLISLQKEGKTITFFDVRNAIAQLMFKWGFAPLIAGGILGFLNESEPDKLQALVILYGTFIIMRKLASPLHYITEDVVEKSYRAIKSMLNASHC